MRYALVYGLISGTIVILTMIAGFELTGPDSARARTYWVAWTDIGPDHDGYYLDSFRKVEDRWLIAHRRIREDWRSSDSLFKGAVANSR